MYEMNQNLFPITIIDNFYRDPDPVRDLAVQQTEWNPDPDGRWPGLRSRNIDEIDNDLYIHFCRLIASVFYNSEERVDLDIVSCFQKISPRHENKYHPKNMGQMHIDGCLFGGLIYLNKENELDTGTSMYTPDKGYYSLDYATWNFKEDDYLGRSNPTDQEYEDVYQRSKRGFRETVKIENVYNRCILFGGNQHHAAQTFGSLKDRLTQVFFCYGVNSSMTYPLCRPIL